MEPKGKNAVWSRKCTTLRTDTNETSNLGNLDIVSTAVEEKRRKRNL